MSVVGALVITSRDCAAEAAARLRLEHGWTLIEALVALGMVVFAASVLVAAAQTNLRALQSAAVLEQLTAAAAADLARTQARGAPAGTEETHGDDPTLGAGAEHRIDVTRSDGIATIEALVAVPGTPPLTLATRMLVPE